MPNSIENLENTEKTIQLKYYKGRDNLACTIFVPFACGNDCPFCTSKQMYQGYNFTKSDVDRIVKWIRILNETDFVNEYVLTGGEPLFNLDITRRLVSEMTKPVYINTTFPIVPGKLVETLEFLSNPKIAGVNVSRHMGLQYSVKIAPDEIVKEIDNYVRINTLITEDMLQTQDIIGFVDYWSGKYTMVNFRADYRTVTPDTLKNRDKISQFLLEHYKYEYSSNCMVCNSEFYSDEKEKILCYHRGLEHSSVTVGGRCYVNDIIIDIKGELHNDWDMNVIDCAFQRHLMNDAEQKKQITIKRYANMC